MTALQLGSHARELATAFKVRLVENDQIKPHEALGLPHLGVALVSPIMDETTYAVALHEIGHLASPVGALRFAMRDPHNLNLQREEERGAWEWARHYALDWTPAMEAVATWAESTYAVPVPAAPASPAKPQRVDWPKPEPVRHIDWSNYR